MNSRTALGAAALFVKILAAGPAPGEGPKPAPVENVSTLPHRSAAEERKALHVPAGFEIQLVAAEPEIHKPLNLAFDDRGRLWVTDTVEYPYPAKPREPAARHGEDPRQFGPDGRARKITTLPTD